MRCSTLLVVTALLTGPLASASSRNSRNPHQAALDNPQRQRWPGPSAPTGPEAARKSRADSITVIHLGPDHPPIVKTVYGTVPNTISGPPYMAMTGDGRYGFVTSRKIKQDPEAPDIISVIDLASADLKVVQTVKLPDPRMAVMHPDGKRSADSLRHRHPGVRDARRPARTGQGQPDRFSSAGHRHQPARAIASSATASRREASWRFTCSVTAMGSSPIKAR